ncbi:hypothetical protein BDW59DRAFT_111807 [Aspergillus cavernicola]|uniref:Transmembrane protein n=1 Tax=Aspergillus cavernicola TaxID=176166 RepID=A0ABR4I238_9EURO
MQEKNAKSMDFLGNFLWFLLSSPSLIFVSVSSSFLLPPLKDFSSLSFLCSILPFFEFYRKINPQKNPENQKKDKYPIILRGFSYLESLSIFNLQLCGVCVFSAASTPFLVIASLRTVNFQVRLFFPSPPTVVVSRVNLALYVCRCSVLCSCVVLAPLSFLSVWDLRGKITTVYALSVFSQETPSLSYLSASRWSCFDLPP